MAIIICYDDTLSWKNGKDNDHDSGEVDASIVTTHMMLQAWELGVGSCWIGSFNPKKVAEAFGIPSNEHPVAILPLGYQAEGCKPSDGHAAYRTDEEMIRFRKDEDNGADLTIHKASVLLIVRTAERDYRDFRRASDA